jgi:NAD(P)-dependent dehydrogenase (short-subunit alcohol dehydrogenase family)
VEKEKNSINIIDHFNTNYNFCKNVYIKRLSLLLPSILLDGNFFFGEEIIYNVANNNEFNKIKNNENSIIWNVYPKCKINLAVIKIMDQNTECVKFIKHKNIVFIINKQCFDNNAMFDNNKFFGDINNIYCSPIGFFQLIMNTYKQKENQYKNLQIPDLSLSNDKSQFGSKQKKAKHVFDSSIHHYCYQCKKKYLYSTTLKSSQYLCIECAIYNYDKNNEVCNLVNNVAFITGIRHTIGFSIALKLLRMGCTVIGTSRFPACAIFNYQKESDYETWKDRLIICQCDFLNMNSVQKTIEFVKTHKPNIIINNACQTVRPTKEYYERVNYIENTLCKKVYGIENKSHNNEHVSQIIKMENNLYTTDNWKLIHNVPCFDMIPTIDIPINFTRNIKDDTLDPRNNSWTKDITQISTTELLEVNVINQIVPTLLIQQLIPHMSQPSFVIQVSAKEGIFNSNKTTEHGCHAHTNMCKSGMNMLIRTLIEMKKKDYYFYAVDPGYVSGPLDIQYPLSINDGAQRIIDPIISFMNGKTLEQGHWKNYKLHVW